jgi:Fe-Mn family superoxide dismutase
MGSPDDVKADEGSFQLEKLPYAYNALAQIYLHNFRNALLKHYLTYNNLNKTVLGTP